MNYLRKFGIEYNPFLKSKDIKIELSEYKQLLFRLKHLEEIKGIGIIKDDILVTNNIVTCGRNVVWKNIQTLRIPRPQEKNNVRANTMYEEFHPDVQQFIINNL